MSSRLPIEPQVLADFCGRHRIRRLSVFGSFIRDDFGPESDIDVLVEFDADEPPPGADLMVDSVSGAGVDALRTHLLELLTSEVSDPRSVDADAADAP